jgi:hypothetical protein
MRNSTTEFGFPERGEAQTPLASIFPVFFGDPSMFVHHSQRSGEGRAVHCEDFSERSLRDVCGERKRLQDRELRNGQSERPQCLVIALAERPSGASKIRAHAGHSWRALHALKMYMHVIAIQKQFEDCEAIEVCIRRWNSTQVHSLASTRVPKLRM